MTSPDERIVIEAELRGDLADDVDSARRSVRELGEDVQAAGRKSSDAAGKIDRVRGSVDKLDRSTDAGARSLNKWERAGERAGTVVGRAIGKGTLGAMRGLRSLSGGLLTGVKALGKYGAAAGLVAVAGGAVLGKSLLDTAARMEGLANKAKVVFGKELPAVSKWAEDSAAKMGVTRSAAVGMAAGFADLLVPMGFSRGEARKMSTDVVGLSGALSQWSGGTRSAAEVSDILSKAMLGERDSLKELGISIMDADVKNELVRKGQDKLTGAALEQAKAQATQTLIFAKSTDAQAAYNKGGLKVAGTLARVKAGFAELKERTATALAPTMLKGLTWLLARMPAFGRALHNIGGEVRESFGSFRESMGDALGAWVGPGSMLNTKDKAGKWGTSVGKVLGGVVRGLGNLIELASKTASSLTDLFAQAAEGGAGMLRSLADVMDSVANLPGPWGDDFRKAAESTRAAAGGLDDLAVKADRLNGKRVVFSVSMTREESLNTLLRTPSVLGARTPQTPQPKGVGDYLSGLTGAGVKPKGARAAGGAIGAGAWLVGERGPEIVEVGGPGFVIPNEAVDRIASGTVRGLARGRYAGESSAGDTIELGGLHFHGDAPTDPAAVERAALRGVTKALAKSRERQARKAS